MRYSVGKRRQQGINNGSKLMEGIVSPRYLASSTRALQADVTSSFEVLLSSQTRTIDCGTKTEQREQKK